MSLIAALCKGDEEVRYMYYFIHISQIFCPSQKTNEKEKKARFVKVTQTHGRFISNESYMRREKGQQVISHMRAHTPIG